MTVSTTTATKAPATGTTKPKYGPIWWENAIFFVVTHIAAAIGMYYYPIWNVSRGTQIMTFVLWHAHMFGMTIGYHRLYSHNAFKATFAVRLILAILGSGAMQGSAKWWALRHRLHHRWTDDPVHDPYAATRGLLWAHMGWIFFKPNYERMGMIERSDLDKDRVVQLQHKYFVVSALLVGFVMPTALGYLWNDVWGGFVWGALVKTVLVWHCTFFINSLAHWEGIQPYSDDNTSRSNTIIAMLTCGEGNHNYHSFPYDYRSSPEKFDWDPSKWVIVLLHKFGLATGLQHVDSNEIKAAMKYMNALNAHGHHHHHHHAHADTDLKVVVEDSSDVDGYVETTVDIHGNVIPVGEKGEIERKLPGWTLEEARAYAAAQPGRCVLVLQGLVVDVTAYMGKHPGGAKLLRQYSIRAAADGDAKDEDWKNATWAFEGGLNRHNLVSVRLMTTMAVAKLTEGAVSA